MQLVLLTGDGPEHRYVANRLASEVGLAAIVVDEGPRTTWLSHGRRAWRRYTVGEMCGRATLQFLRIVWRDSRERIRCIRNVLGEARSTEFLRPDLVRRVRGINSPEAAKLVAALTPDRILVYGTGVVRDPVLRASRMAPVNMHTGMSPWYRGASCAFWPLHNEELHMLGATVHECVAIIDGGRILARRQAELARDDGVFEVFARCVRTGTDLYVEVLRQLDRGTLEPPPQGGASGREYRAAMRGPRAELRVRRLIRGGLVRRFAEERTQLSAALERASGRRP